ncbi:MAG: ribosome silencing factor [Ignavibacteria bacterium]|nr:ribosome silencing factor [Bacteroidota bacterium]MSQ45476.1 ribosome silencing factor [Ignavibacteria bacterium]
MTPRILAKKIAKITLSKKATDVVILDIKKLTTMTDYFVICSASSNTQVRAIADEIIDEMKEIDKSHVQGEGYTEGSWVIIDLFNIVVHIFQVDARNYYDIEKLWEDAKREIIVDKPVVKKKKASTRKKK